jgi:hypothetical protein
MPVVEKKKCPSGKILNPVSQKCVKVDGKVGLQIISDKANKAKPKEANKAKPKEAKEAKEAKPKEAKPKEAKPKEANKAPNLTIKKKEEKPKEPIKASKLPVKPEIEKIPEKITNKGSVDKKNEKGWRMVMQSLYRCVLKTKGTRIHLEFEKNEYIVRASPKSSKIFSIITFNSDAEIISKKEELPQKDVDEAFADKQGCVGIYLSLDRLNDVKNILMMWSPK